MIRITNWKYRCECGHIDCGATINSSPAADFDFLEYCDQRDKYCLISKFCKRASEILPEKIAVEGEDYLIVEEG